MVGSRLEFKNINIFAIDSNSSAVAILTEAQARIDGHCYIYAIMPFKRERERESM